MTALEGGASGTDTDLLAHLGREALAAAQGGTLHIHGLDTSGRTAEGLDVLFYDDEGRPTFLCPPNSPVAVAASRRRPAVLSVDAGPYLDALGTVILAGQLALVGTEEVRGESVLLVGLLAHSVVIEQDDPRLPTVAQRAVPLAAWNAATPDPIAPAAARMIAHTNQSHGGELRAFVAGLRGIPEAGIIAAEITELDVHGFGLDWLDARGAHSARFAFPVPAHCPATLAARLRESLHG